jgi:hypothetical protein
MRAWLLVLALCGCDRAFGIGDPYEDAPPATGPHDVQPLDIGRPLEDVMGTDAASLIVRYPFNGDLSDSTHTMSATATGTITTAGTGGPFTSRGYAGLDGTACITFPMPQTPDTFSIVLWVESISTVTAAVPLFARPHAAATTATTRDWAFFGNSAEVEFQMLDSTETQIYPIMPGVATTWHQYAVTFDGTYVRVYSDGMIAGPLGPAMPVMYSGAGIVYLGCDGSSDGTTKFAGRFAEVQIYAGVLTDQQVMQLSVDPTPP